MKRVKSANQKIEASIDVADRWGKFDKAILDAALSRIVKAAEKIDREVDDLLAKARK